MLEINPEKANASDGDVILRKSLFANAEKLHLRSDGVLRRTPVGSIPDAVVSCFVDTKQRYDAGNLKLRRRINRYALSLIHI